MLVSDARFNKTDVVKRIRFIRRYGRIIIKPGRRTDCFVQFFLTLVLSPLLLIALDAPGQMDVTGRIVSLFLFAIPQCIAFFALWARGWSLVLDTDNAFCQYTRTYLWRARYSANTDLTQGVIGPSMVRLRWDERTQSQRVLPASIVLFLLGPLGVLLGAVAHFSQRKFEVVNDYPGIIYYNETTDESTVLLVLETPTLRKRVLAAFSELAPESVSTV